MATDDVVRRRLRALAEAQAGLVTRAQLRELGCPPGMIRWELGRRWQAVLPSVISLDRGPLSTRQRMIAALLHAGPDAVIACSTAAALHGVTAAEGGSVHVLVPLAQHVRPAGFVVVHRTRRPEARPWQRESLVVCSPARAVVDAAREARTPDAARAIVLEAVERRLVLPSALRHELECGARQGSAGVREAVEQAEAGAWSVPEDDLLRLVARSRVLPVPWANPRLLRADGTPLPTPDLWFDSVAMAVQVHSRRHHSSPDQWDATVMTDGALVECGVVLLGVTPRAVSVRPDLVLSRLEKGHAVAAARLRPPVVALPRRYGSVA